MVPSSRLTAVLLACLVLAPLPASGQAEAVPVTFEINDSMIKDKALQGVEVGIAYHEDGEFATQGRTDARGRVEFRLPPGNYWAAYRLTGYVPLPRSRFAVGAEPLTITTTLTMLLEATGESTARRVQIVLNWGSQSDQVRDADAHLRCPCGGDNAHVYFATRQHRGPAGWPEPGQERVPHEVELDVDDTDWGGPETITLSDPPPGVYRYWVHDYSDGPGTLGSSDVVVRVIIGDAMAGEFRPASEMAARTWRPFRALVVGDDLVARVVPYSDAELAAGADRQGEDIPQEEFEGPDVSCASCAGFAIVVFGILLALVLRAARRHART